MTNCKIDVKGDTMTITVDISEAARKAAAASKSGKTKVLSSTHGFANFNGVGLSLNATVR